MSKRKRIQSGSDDPARKTCEAVAGAFAVSDASKRLIFNAAAVALGHEEEVRTEDGWKRMSQNLLPKVAKPIEVLNSDPQKPPVVFYLASVKALLQLVVKECQNYATLLQKTIASRPGQCLSIILYNDEVTSGNIVAVSTAKKVSLWYFCILEMGRRWSDCMWHPMCLLQHADFDNVQGGFSHVAKAIISSIESENLGQGFSVQLPDGYHLLRLELSFMMGDLDAARAGLDQKGSSGIRPCLYCKNVVKKNSQLVTINPMFKEIGSSDIRNFLEQSDSDIFTVYDNLGVTQPTMRKTAFTKKEQCAGFKYNSNGLLADQVLRNVIPPSKWLVDHMHIYWSNGICSWEVVSMFQLWQEQGHGDLTQFLSLDWCTSGGESCTQSWRNFLGHESMFTGNTYKGLCFKPHGLFSTFPLLFGTHLRKHSLHESWHEKFPLIAKDRDGTAVSKKCVGYLCGEVAAIASAASRRLQGRFWRRLHASKASRTLSPLHANGSIPVSKRLLSNGTETSTVQIFHWPKAI